MKFCRSAAVCWLACAGCQVPSAAVDAELGVRLIYASSQERHVDARLRTFLSQFPDSPLQQFTSFQVRDEATFDLPPQTTGHLQLPDHSWFAVVARGPDDDGAQRLELALDTSQITATLALAPGATVALSGPPYAGGRFVVSVTLIGRGVRAAW